MLKEFRDFAMRGNVVDMAVGIVLGLAFAAIVNSLVNDVLMPPIGLAIGGADFSELYLNLGEESYASLAAAREAGAPVVAYGVFLNTIVSFILVAAALFLVVKGANRLRRQSPPPTPTEKPCPRCATAIPLAASRCPHCTSELQPAGA